MFQAPHLESGYLPHYTVKFKSILGMTTTNNQMLVNSSIDKTPVGLLSIKIKIKVDHFKLSVRLEQTFLQ